MNRLHWSTFALIAPMVFAFVAQAQPTLDFKPTDSDPVKLAINSTLDLPYIITAGGQLLAPASNDAWIDIRSPAAVRDVYIESGGRVWAATDAGLAVYENDLWQIIDDKPAQKLESTHGYLFSMGPDGVSRLQQGREINLEHFRALEMPIASAPAHDLVMLGSHTHVLHVGDQVFQTMDVGLSWRPLDAPDAINSIGTDTGGDLLAVTADSILQWHEDRWRDFSLLPDDQQIDELLIFHDQMYTLAGGSIFQHSGDGWEQQFLPDSRSVYFTSLVVQYPDKLWVLDARGARLWCTQDGINWKSLPVRES